MKKVIATVLLFVSLTTSAQELNLPVATQYLADNQFVISPVFAGIGDNIRIRANGFFQWIGVKDAPNNQAIYADFRIGDQTGLGINLYNDKNGYTRQTGGRLSFAHHIVLDYPSRQYLSFGISYNLNNFRIEIDKFAATIPVFDPAIVNDRFTANNNFDVGLLYRNKGFFASFNASNLIPKDIDKFTGIEPKLLRNYQLYTGLTYRSDRDSRMEYEPSAYFQYFESDGRSSTDVNIKLRYFDNQRTGYVWGGLAYRFLNDQPMKPLNVGPMVGIKKGSFYFGYTYQLILNQLSSYNSGTHMATIGFDFLQGISNCPCTQTEILY